MVAALTRKTFRNSILCVPAEIRACSFGRRRAGGFPALAGSVCLVGWLLGAALLLLGACGAVVDGRVLFDGCTVPAPARWRQWHQALYISTANWQLSSCPKLLSASLAAEPGATAARPSSLHSRDDACRPWVGALWSSYDETTARVAMYSAVAWWLDNGAPPAMGRVLRAVRGAVLERLLPRKGSGPRTFGWWYLGALLSFTELVCLCRGPLHRNKCRLALRCLPPGLHACLLARDFSSPFWKIQWRGVLAGFHPCADKASGNLAVVYVLAEAKSGLYYVGKSCSSRTRGGQQWPGAVVRFSEHLLGSFDPVYRKRAPEDRYKVWRRSKPHHLIFVPLVWAENSCVDRLESLIIRTAAPPTQSFLKVAPRARPGSRRGWPRFREPLSAHGEVASNALLALAVDRSSLACRMWLSWKQWAAQWLATSGKPIWQLEVLLYTPEYEEALVVRLGEARARLDYERLWRTGGTEKACRLWTMSARLPTRQRRRVRDKLSRFLRGYIAVRAPVLRLPATSRFQVAAVHVSTVKNPVPNESEGARLTARSTKE